VRSKIIAEQLSGFSVAERPSRSRLSTGAVVIPKFHFHLDPERDEQGLELTNVAAAKCEALDFAARHICDDANAFWDREEWSLTVTNDSGLTLLQLQIVGTQSSAVPSRAARHKA
jgi:hypothetical protein